MSSCQELKNANKLMRNGKVDEAIAAYNRVIKYNPNLSWSYYYLGEALAKKCKLKEAVTAYHSALDINPNFGWCCYSLGKVLLQIEQLELAIEYLRKAININPNFSEFYYNLGLALRQKNVIDESLSCFQKSIELNPKFSLSYINLGELLLKAEKWSEAIVAYQKAFELKPELLSQYFADVALALRKQGMFPQLIGLYRHVIKLHPQLSNKLPIVFPTQLGNSLLANHKISYVEVPIHNQSIIKSTVTIHQTIHHNFTYKLLNVNHFVVTIPKGFVLSNDTWGVVLTDAESEILIKRMYRQPNITGLKPIKKPPLLNLEGRAVFLSSRWGDNYYHWMFDIISRVELLIKSGIKLSLVDKFIVNSPTKKFQKETFDLLGIPQAKIVESFTYNYIQADRLIFPSFPLPVPSKGNCEYIRQVLMQFNKLQILSDFQERIYISRNDSSLRLVINEEEVIDFLSQYGFKSFTMSSMSVVEQAYLFSRAKVIVSPHGAALTNIVCCQPGTKIIEIFGYDSAGNQSINNCYYIISNHCNLEHYHLVGEPSTTKDNLPKKLPKVWGLDIKINIDLLSNLMNYAGII